MPTSAARLQSAGLTASTVLVLVAALSMLQPLSTDLYLPTLPGIARALDADVPTVQWTLSVFVAAFGAWQLVAGPLADRFGRLPVILGGLGVYTASSLLCMLAPSIEVLIVGRLLQAIGACSVLVGMRALVRDLYAPTEGARLLATSATLMSLAPLAGPLLGALLYAQFGWRSSFALLTAFGCALALVVALRLRETLRHPRRDALRLGPMLQAYGSTLASPTFRAYAAASTTSYGALFAYLAGSSFVLIQVLGITPTAYGLSLCFTVFGYMLGTLACRHLLVRAGLQRTVQLGAGLQCASGLALALLALAGVQHWAAIIVPFFFFSISHGLVQPAAQAGAVAPFPQQAGSAAALMGCVMMAVAACVGIWIGASYNGTVLPMALTIGAIATLTALVAATLVRRHGDVSRHD